MGIKPIAEEIKDALYALALAEKAAFFPKFFKTGKGEYGEGDLFLGVTVPEQRKVAKFYQAKAFFDDLSILLESPYHEHRLTALLILVGQYEKSKTLEQRQPIIDFYLKHLHCINNWDLVDTSCYKILGHYCYTYSKEIILRDLAHEDHLWKKRIAVVSTMHYVKQSSFDLTKEFVLLNLQYNHDLMHKANGWLIREMGKKSEEDLLKFLDHNYSTMPRTTLRYAIEHLDEETRQSYLKGKV